MQKKKRELTHMRSMCVGVAETGGWGINLFFWLLTGLGFYLLFYSNFVFIVLLYDQKYQKSARRTRAILLPNHRGVHELVARSSAWRVCAAKG